MLIQYTMINMDKHMPTTARADFNVLKETKTKTLNMISIQLVWNG